MIGIHARMHNEIGWQSDQPEHRDRYTNLLPTIHSRFSVRQSNKNHYDNRSSNKQSNKPSAPSLADPVSGDALLRNPTSGKATCCACAASGHPTLAPVSAINSRRLIVSPVQNVYCALQGSIFSPCAGNRWWGPNSPATRPGASPPTSPRCVKYCVNRELLPACPKLKAQRAQPVALQGASSAKLLWAAARPSSFLRHRPTSGSVQGTRGRARYSRSPPA